MPKDEETNNAGKVSSFVVGFLLSAIFTVFIAIIVGVIWRRKNSNWFWFGALFGFILFILFIGAILTAIGLGFLSGWLHI
jgi:hypothetical protein